MIFHSSLNISSNKCTKDGFDTICKRTDEGMHSCKSILKFVAKRADIEGEYSKSLRNLVSKYSSKIVETGYE